MWLVEGFDDQAVECPGVSGRQNGSCCDLETKFYLFYLLFCDEKEQKFFLILTVNSPVLHWKTMIFF